MTDPATVIAVCRRAMTRRGMRRMVARMQRLAAEGPSRDALMAARMLLALSGEKSASAVGLTPSGPVRDPAGGRLQLVLPPDEVQPVAPAACLQGNG